MALRDVKKNIKKKADEAKKVVDQRNPTSYKGVRNVKRDAAHVAQTVNQVKGNKQPSKAAGNNQQKAVYYSNKAKAAAQKASTSVRSGAQKVTHGNVTSIKNAQKSIDKKIGKNVNELSKGLDKKIEYNKQRNELMRLTRRTEALKAYTRHMDEKYGVKTPWPSYMSKEKKYDYGNLYQTPLDILEAEGWTNLWTGQNFTDILKALRDTRPKKQRDLETFNRAVDNLEQSLWRSKAQRQELSTWDKQNLPPEQQRLVQYAKQRNADARKAGKNEDALKAHRQAESIRAGYGYSGGDEGDEYISPDIPKDIAKRLNKQGQLAWKGAQLRRQRAVTEEEISKADRQIQQVMDNPAYEKINRPKEIMQAIGFGLAGSGVGMAETTDAMMNADFEKDMQKRWGDVDTRTLNMQLQRAKANLEEYDRNIQTLGYDPKDRNRTQLQTEVLSLQAAMDRRMDPEKYEALTTVEPDSLGQRLTQKRAEHLERAERGLGTVGRYAVEGVEMLGEVLPTMAIAPVGGQGASLLAMGVQAAGSRANELNARGISPDQVFARSALSGMSAAATEKIPLERLGKMFTGKAGRNFVRNFFTQMGVEIGTEEADYVANYIMDVVAKDPEAQWSWADIRDTAILTAISAGIIDAPASMVNQFSKPVEPTGNQDQADEIKIKTVPNAQEVTQVQNVEADQREEKTQAVQTNAELYNAAVKAGSMTPEEKAVAKQALEDQYAQLAGQDPARPAVEQPAITEETPAEPAPVRQERTQAQTQTVPSIEALMQAARENNTSNQAAERARAQQEAVRARLQEMQRTQVPAPRAETRATPQPTEDVVAGMGKTLSTQGRALIETAAPQGPSDRVQYAGDFVRVYEGTFNGQTNVPAGSLNPAQYQAAVRAGQADRAESMETGVARSRKQVVAGRPVFVYDSYAQGRVSKEDAKVIAGMAQIGGLSVRFGDQEEIGNVQARGVILGNEVILSKTKLRGGSDVVTFVAGHETAHRLQDIAPKEYRALRDYVMGMDEYANQVDRIMERYAKADVNLSRERAMDEVVADFAGQLIADHEQVRNFIQQYSGDRNVLQKILDVLRELASMLTGKYKAEVDQGVKLLEDALKAGSEATKQLNKASRTETKVLQNVGIQIDTKTESAAPQFSFGSWNESGYVKDRDNAAKVLAKRLKVTQKQAKHFIDSVNSVAKIIADDRTRLDYISSPGRSPFVSNVEYGGSIDFSTICKKRRLFTGTIDAIQRAMPDRVLMADEMLKIRAEMKKRGYEVGCGLCYVEGSRVKIGKYTKEFLDGLKAEGAEYVPTLAEMNTVEGQEDIRLNHPETYEKYVKFMNKLAQRKPKLFQMATEYKREILDAFEGKEESVKEKNKNGGLRLQSFSDFEIIHLIDCMQVIMDMSRVGLAGQAYTKQPEFAWALGNTGLKINLSLIAKGVDENGGLIFDDVEGMPIKDAMELRDHYSQNVGTVIVVFNDQQLLAALADDRIDFVLPFHRSQWNKKQYDTLGLPQGTKDYTLQQNEKYIMPVRHKNRNGKWVKERPANYMPNEYWNFRKSGKWNAEQYLKMCAENNRRPKFFKLLVNNGDGSYSLQPDGSTDGYWKLLIDFKMYDNEGNGSAQKPVRPEFNMDEAQKMLNDYAGGHENFPVAQDIVDEFVGGARFSLPPVDPITPKSGGWERGATFEEVKTNHPTLFALDADEADTRNPTQIKGTVSTYRKIYNALQKDGFDGTILDASSGLGYGTQVGRDEFGYDVDDIEPFPDKSYSPRYTDYSTLDKTYDVIISNAVLNVIPQDLRDAMVVKIGKMLNPGGRAFINVRGTDVKNAGSKVPINEEQMEYFISNTGSYQKGFTPGELVAYLRDALGSGFSVERGKGFGAVSAVVTKKDGARFSISPQADALEAEYQEALEANDPDWQAMLVGQAAFQAGYTTGAYHGSPFTDITVFNTRSAGDKTEKLQLLFGTHFTQSKDFAEIYAKKSKKSKGTSRMTTKRGKVYDVYLDLGKSLDLRTPKNYQEGDEIFSLYQDLPEKIKKKAPKHTYTEAEVRMGLPGGDYVNTGDIEKALQAMTPRDATDFLVAHGYNSVEYLAAYNTGEWDNNRYSKDLSIIMLDPERIKSADPVTYDDNGNVIPLSERFNPEKEDIRYSIGTEGLDEARLMRENQQLREKLEYWKGQVKPSDRTKVNPKDVRKLARELAKNYSTTMDTTEIADALQTIYDGIGKDWAYDQAYDAARKLAIDMVEQASEPDDYLYNEYDPMRRFFRENPLVLSEFDRNQITDYNDWRKARMGKLRIQHGTTSNIDQVYQEASALWPEWFDEEREVTSLDQLDRIVEVMDSIYNREEQNPFGDDMEGPASYLAAEIMNDFWDMSNVKKTYADRAEARLGREVSRRLDMQEKYEQKLQEVRENREKKLRQQKEKYLGREKARSQRQKERELRAKILRHCKKLSTKLKSPTDTKHIPEDLVETVRVALMSINLSSKDGKETKRTQAFEALRRLYADMEREGSPVVIDQELAPNIADIIGFADTPIENLGMRDLDTIWRTVKAIENTITTYNKALGKAKFETISEPAFGIRDALGWRKDRGDYRGAFRQMDKLLNFQMLTPEAFFRRLGASGRTIFRMLRDAQDKHILIMNNAKKRTGEIIGKTNVKKLEKEMHTFRFDGETVQFTTAQIMSLYELMKRQQAVDHIMIGGIRPESVRKGIKDMPPSSPWHLTQDQVSEVLAALSEDEVKLADKLQHYLGDVMAKLGNEASLAVYGYRKFNEQNYFPISVDKNQVQSDVKNDAVSGTIAGWGSARPVTPNANNAVIVRSIFDVYADHVTEMANYAAWLAPMENLNRIFNFRYKDENGTVKGGVKDQLEKAFGQNGKAYWKQLQNDLNNGVHGRDDSPFSAFMGTYKASAIGANIRVIAQQPTAILRALDSINPADYIAGLTRARIGKFDRVVKKYAPIAIWKDWGYFQTDTGRQMRNVLYDDDSPVQKLNQVLMAGAGKADSISWTAIWNALEIETKRKRKDLAPRSDEFYRAVAERFNEVVDHTQVVDGILQRSQIMRSADGLTKMATSFMAEPTKTYNMVLSDIYDVRNSMGSERTAAMRRLARTVFALTVSITANAAAQSLVDALRDDDKDEGYWEKFFQAYFGLEGETRAEKIKAGILNGNIESSFNPLTYIPYLKDIISQTQGYSVSRMDMDTISRVLKAYTNVTKAMNGEGKNTVQSAWLNLVAETGRFLGIPVANIKRDVQSISRTYFAETGNYRMLYEYEKFLYDVTSTNTLTEFSKLILGAERAGDEEAAQAIRQDMIDSGVNEEKLNKKLDELRKKEVTDTEEFQTELANLSETYATMLESNDTFNGMEIEQQDKVRTTMANYAQFKVLGDRIEVDNDKMERIAEIEQQEMRPTDWVIFKTQFDDLHTIKDENGKDVETKQEQAIKLIDETFETEDEKRAAYRSVYDSDKNNPWA